MDKPGTKEDYYHTAYSLSGLSGATQGGPALFAEEPVNLNAVNNLYNIVNYKVLRGKAHFSNL